jgi:hypothetical protein
LPPLFVRNTLTRWDRRPLATDRGAHRSLSTSAGCPSTVTDCESSSMNMLD